KFSVMRPSLLPGLVDAAAHNRRREHADVRLFETGTRFGVAAERREVAGVWCGSGTSPHWSGGMRGADFYDVKGAVEAVGSAFGLTLEFEPASVPYLVDGRSATVSFAIRENMSRRFGLLGQIDPRILEARGFPSGDELWAFELELDALGVLGDGD